ncbi:MAG: copper transport protein, partial [Thermoplasmata archaeon]|nr:copper transport protein [Thermoplasmata archaeon]
MRSFLPLALALLVCGAPAASAHAYLASGEPGPDSHVELAPARLRLAFTEELEHQVTHAAVLDLNGTHVDRGQEFPPGEPTVLLVDLAPLKDGVYTVDWVTLSVDAHTAQGSYVFAVGNATLEGAPGPTAVHVHPGGAFGWIEPAAHALLFAGLALAAGLAFFALTVQRAPDLRLLRVAALGALAAVAGSVLSLMAVAHRTDLSLTALVTSTGTGGWIATRTVLLAAAAFTLVRRARVGLVLAAGALVATSFSSHAAAAATGRALALATDVAHMAAATVWVGGVVGLALVLPGANVERAALLVRRFSPWAMGSVLLLVATGTYASFLHLPAWADLVREPYGQAILAKV